MSDITRPQLANHLYIYDSIGSPINVTRFAAVGPIRQTATFLERPEANFALAKFSLKEPSLRCLSCSILGRPKFWCQSLRSFDLRPENPIRRSKTPTPVMDGSDILLALSPCLSLVSPLSPLSTLSLPCLLVSQCGGLGHQWAPRPAAPALSRSGV
jgi:hypothetical protein